MAGHPAKSDYSQVHARVPCSPAPCCLQVGWTKTWSAYPPLCRQYGEAAAEALMQQFTQDMVAALGVPDEHTPVVVVWKVDMVLARRPVPLSNG